MERKWSEMIFGNHLIMENIIRCIPSNELFAARLINQNFKHFVTEEIVQRGSHVIHLNNENKMIEFMKYLDQEDLNQFSIYSFKIPIGDFEEHLLDQFIEKVGRKIKLLELYEGYDTYFEPPSGLDRWHDERDKNEFQYSYKSRDWKNFTDTYGIEYQQTFVGDDLEFLNKTKTMLKFYKFLDAASETLSNLSLRFKTELIIVAAKFPDKIPELRRLKSFNLTYDSMYHVIIAELGNRDIHAYMPKFYMNIVEKANNLKSGHIVASICFKSLLSEIGSIKFRKGGRPLLDTRFQFSPSHTPIIEKLMEEQYLNRIIFLDVNITKRNPTAIGGIASDENFLDLLYTLHKLIVSQSKSLHSLCINACTNHHHYENVNDPDESSFISRQDLVFNPPRPVEPFTNLKVLNIYPMVGKKYKYLKEFFKGDYPVLADVFPYFDLDDPNLFEPHNVTFPEEVYKETKRMYELFIKYHYPLQ